MSGHARRRRAKQLAFESECRRRREAFDVWRREEASATDAMFNVHFVPGDKYESPGPLTREDFIAAMDAWASQLDRTRDPVLVSPRQMRAIQEMERAIHGEEAADEAGAAEGHQVGRLITRGDLAEHGIVWPDGE